MDNPHRQNLEQYATKTLVPGRGVGELTVGRTTLAEVKKLFGETNAFEHHDGSSEHRYVNGLSVVTEPARDPNGVIRSICAQRNIYGTGAFQGKTDKGIGLGATREEVLAAYGEPVDLGALKSILSYKSGVTFQLRKGTVTEIVIQRSPW